MPGPFAVALLAVALAACGRSATPMQTVSSARTATSTPRGPSSADAPRSGSALPSAPAPRAYGSTIGLGNVPRCLQGGNPTPVLRRYGASVLRVVLTPLWGGAGSGGEALACLRAASAEGYRVHLVIQYLNVWSIQQAASYLEQVLSYYARYAWAVSIGNEQELYQGGPGQTGTQYAAEWRALEPLVAQRAPQAILVAGEVSPWGWQFLRRAVGAGLPGARALAAHVYTYRYHFQIPSFEAWCGSLGLPCWFTEGAYYAGSAAPDAPFSQLRGAPVIEAWLGY